MPPLLLAVATVIGAVASLFLKCVFGHATLLLVEAILAPDRRTIAAVLRVVGNNQDGRFQNDHRVLNRARGLPINTSRVLLGLLLDAFMPEGAVVIGIDETIERRRGAKISAKGIDRDPVRRNAMTKHVAAGRNRCWIRRDRLCGWCDGGCRRERWIKSSEEGV